MALGPYLVERRLSEGGTSVLFLAHDPALRRPVVLKVIHDEGDPAATRGRLIREARALAAVDHPGVVRVYGTGEHEGAAYLAVEYVAGRDLKRAVSEGGPFTQERALRVVLLATEALTAAHDTGVLHRDVKPSNILLTEADGVKLVDFGVARRRYDMGDVYSSRLEFVGTAAYLAPEQLEHGLSDERSDIWGLGCVLYELIAGGPPFGRANSPSTMAAILRDEPVFPAAMKSSVQAVVAGCLKKNSFLRIGSTRELMVHLREALGEISSQQRLSEPPRARPSFRPSVTPPPGTIRSSRPPPPISARVLRASQPSSDAVPASTTSMGRIKGVALRAGLAWFWGKYGHEALCRVVDRSSAPLRGFLRKGEPALGVIASGWYDAQLVGELVERLLVEAGGDDPEAFFHALTEAVAKDNVSGIYRSLFKLIATPALLERNAQRVWRTYSDDGTCATKLLAPGQMRVTVDDWATHAPVVCGLVSHLMQNTLREVGFTAMVIDRVQCVADGSPTCVFEGMWLPSGR